MFLSFASDAAMASSISIEIKAGSTCSNGLVFVNLAVSNRGDESAKSLWVDASLGASRIRGNMGEVLGTNETFQVRLGLGPIPKPAGTYCVPVVVRYTDMNGYPSTATATVPVVTAEPDDSPLDLSAGLDSVSISDEGEIWLSLSTRGQEAIGVSLSLLSPDELSCFLSSSSTTVVPGKVCKVGVKIRNVSALKGSLYRVTAIIDYMDRGVHGSKNATGAVKIVDPAGGVFKKVNSWSIAAVLLVVLFVAVQFVCRHKEIDSSINPPGRRFDFDSVFDLVCSVAVLLAIFGFILCNIPPKYLFMDSTITGGDAPAHTYMASHLHDQLFRNGRIVSWAGGWWCGFPMFQFYFCLPYLLVALLSVLIPFNIAFKLVSVLGIFLLPASAYVAGRMMRLAKSIPILMAIATIPFLFTRAHVMWGGNIYSTLAGMISNSISLPLMILFIASSWLDADDGKSRIRTVILLVLLLASHFFTSVIGGLCVAIIPFLMPKSGMRKAIITLGTEYGLAILLMAWWLIPLIAKTEFTVDFGANWDLVLLKTISPYLLWPLLLLAGYAVVRAVVERIAPITLLCWMLVVSVFLYYFGFNHLAKVFVNVRLWPFIFLALLFLAAAGTGLLISNLRFKGVACLAILLVTLAYGIDKPNDVQSWAKWNYEGLENKPHWQAFQKLTGLLVQTQGRLANDLHGDNNSLGSSRVFECVPHITGKPILEGGLVNSSVGSIFSYYIQSESSEVCAGFPNIVTPSSFNFDNATRHLKLFNIKHFIARGTAVKQAISVSKDWKFLDEADGWQLYELADNDGSYVSVLENMPIAVRIDSSDKDSWKKAGLEWMYSIKLIDQPFALLRHGETDEGKFKTIMREDEFLKYCRSARCSEFAARQSIKVSADKIIKDEEVNDHRIRFRTNAVGMPHLIKCTYFPNWKVKGAKKIFMVTPCFMLVYPEQSEVELYYGYTTSDHAGISLSIMGLLLVAVWFYRSRR